MERDDDLKKQIEQQLASADGPARNVSQPVGGPSLLDPGSDAISGGVSEMKTGPVTPSGPSMADRVRAAKTAGYKDIEGADALRTGGFTGALEGFNTNAWGSGERGTNTQKNSFGKIASRYDPTRAGASRALMADEDFRAMFPDATLIDHPNADLIDFDGPGGDPPVDVLRAATAGGAGQAWQYGVQDGGGSGGDGSMTVDGLMGSDPLSAIQAKLGTLAQGEGGDEQTLIQQILRGEL